MIAVFTDIAKPITLMTRETPVSYERLFLYQADL